MVSPNDCSMGARIGFSVLGVVLGLAVTIVFAAEYHNFSASVWAFASGVAAALTLFVHVTYLERWYEDVQHPLRHQMYCGYVFQMVSLCGFVVYVLAAMREKQGVIIYGEGYYFTAVWCFMTLSWGFQLSFFSRSYWRTEVGDNQLVIPDEKTHLQAISVEYESPKAVILKGC